MRKGANRLKDVIVHFPELITSTIGINVGWAMSVRLNDFKMNFMK